MHAARRTRARSCQTRHASLGVPAGQNRSAALAVAVELLSGRSLEGVLRACARERPFILENIGFQRQIIELEARLRSGAPPPSMADGFAEATDAADERGAAQPFADEEVDAEGVRAKRPRVRASDGAIAVDARPGSPGTTMVELSVPGLRTFTLTLPEDGCSIDGVKELAIALVDAHLAQRPSEEACRIHKAWLLFSTFTYGPECSLLLEEEAVDLAAQLARLRTTFGLPLAGGAGGASDAMEEASSAAETRVSWGGASRFELILFSIVRREGDTPEPFKFRHQERPGAPGTLLAESPVEPSLRAWDFVTGEAYTSTQPIVFSFSDDPRSKRDFMNVSRSRGGERQQFNAPGEGGILGMGRYVWSGSGWSPIIGTCRFGPLLSEPSSLPVRAPTSPAPNQPPQRVHTQRATRMSPAAAPPNEPFH